MERGGPNPVVVAERQFAKLTTDQSDIVPSQPGAPGIEAFLQSLSQKCELEIGYKDPKA